MVDVGAEIDKECPVMVLESITRGHYGKCRGSRHEAPPKVIALSRTKVYGGATRKVGRSNQRASGTCKVGSSPGRARYKGNYRRKSDVAEQNKQGRAD